MSRPTAVYTWIARLQAEGRAGWRDRPRRRGGRAADEEGGADEQQ
jgi:hypothetical protein